MELTTHIKSGSEINIDTYDLYKDQKGDSPCHLIKLSGIDSEGSKFKVTIFSAYEEQTKININNEDNIKVLMTRPSEEL